MHPPSVEPPAIEMHGISRRFGGREVLRGIDLRIETGELFALLGPNGAGKSTLMSILSTLCAPTSGRAGILGRDVVREAGAVRAAIGVVFQETALEQRLSAADNLQLMARCYGMSGRAARLRAAELLQAIGLAGVAGHAVQALSGGQRRRLELARALVAKPRVLLLDEATLGLDVLSRHAFWAEVRALARQACTVFFTTHYMEEAQQADRVALIDAGRIVTVDTPQQLCERHGGIILKTDDDGRACDWLLQHGYSSALGPDGVFCSCADRGAVLPRLLRELPFRVSRVEFSESGLEAAFLQLTGRSPAGGARPAAVSFRKEQLA